MMKIGIILGRFNPPHLGHVRLIRHAMSQNDIVYIVIIQGEKTGADLVRNPLSYDLKKKIINQAIPQAQVIRYGSANIPKITYEIIKDTWTYDKKYHVSIYTGSDRVAQYAAQIKPKYIKQLKNDLGDSSFDITMEIRSLEREESSKNVEGYSASKVRTAIRNGEDEKAMEMLAISDEDIYDEVKSAVLAGIKKESIEEAIKYILGRV